MIAELAIWLGALLHQYAPACSSSTEPVSFAQQLACVDLVRRARAAGLGAEEALVVELSFRESRWRPGARNKRTGCTGMLQASPRYWCPGGTAEGCDATEAGLRALATYLGQHPKDRARAVCRFRGGRCSPAGYERSETIIRAARARAASLRHTGRIDRRREAPTLEDTDRP